MSVYQALDQYNERKAAYREKQERENEIGREDRDNKLEGNLKYKEELRKNEMEHDAYVYHSANEANIALTHLKPIDLTSEKTTMKEAVDFCKDFMVILSKCEDLEFSDEDRKIFQDTMRVLGLASYDEVNEKFKGDSEGRVIGRCIEKQDSIEFPLIVATKLLKAENSKDFEHYIKLHTKEREGEPSDALVWFEAQRSAEVSL